MNIDLNFTPFRRIIRPLTLYSETTRSGDLDGKIKWVITDTIQMFGYQQPDYQTRLTEIRLNENSVPVVSNDYPDFLIEAPTTRGMGTATGGEKMTIEIDPKKEYLTILTDDFTYNIKKSWGTRGLDIKKHLLPMENIKIKGSISGDRFQKYVHTALSGPLRLKISNDVVKFISSTHLSKGSFDITDSVTVLSNNIAGEYSYDIHLLSEILEKFPRNKQIELSINEDLIRLRCTVGDNVGRINYYQRGRVVTSRTSRY